jgi:hypothetical protein
MKTTIVLEKVRLITTDFLGKLKTAGDDLKRCKAVSSRFSRRIHKLTSPADLWTEDLCKRNSLQIHVDGRLVFSIADSSLAGGTIGLYFTTIKEAFSIMCLKGISTPEAFCSGMPSTTATCRTGQS